MMQSPQQAPQPPSHAPLPDPFSPPAPGHMLVSVPGFEGRRIEIQPGGAWGSSKLFVDGLPAPPGPKKGKFALRRNDGAEIVAFFKGGFPDPAPVLVVGEHTIRTADPLSTGQWIWAGFPLVLMILGGAIGGLLGGVATTVNVQLLRSGRKGVVPYVLSGLVSLAAIFGWLLVVSLIRR